MEKHLSQMTLEELIRPEGIRCSCGKVHRCGLKWFKTGSGIIRELSKQGGQIISTGGGAVLRPENVSALRQNGRLFWLNRDPDALVPTDDRPLADTAAKMKRLWLEREPVYRAAADEMIPVTGTPESAADDIESR